MNTQGLYTPPQLHMLNTCTWTTRLPILMTRVTSNVPRAVGSSHISIVVSTAWCVVRFKPTVNAGSGRI